MSHQKKIYPADSVVEKAIQIAGGKVSELTFKISTKVEKPISRQTFQGWRNRAAFSIEVIPAVHAITRIPMSELIEAARKSTAKKPLIEQVSHEILGEQPKSANESTVDVTS